MNESQVGNLEIEPQTTDYDVIIIGAGFSGLYALHKLRDGLGLKVRVLEKGGGVGGTWYWNRYPGARCDSESYYYSYSFSSELEQEWEWSERYPDHQEIRKYLNFVANKFNLMPDIQLSTIMTSGTFNDSTNCWEICTDNGQIFHAPFLITGVGCLSTANVPDIPGLDSFAGEWVHTGAWPHEGKVLKGKRVGQIGTGSTGIQAAPALAEEAAHLTVFQRTANYSIPARNAPLEKNVQQDIKANYPAIRDKARAAPNGHPFDFSQTPAMSVSDTERQEIYEKAWDVGGLRFRAAFKDLLSDATANASASDFIREKISEVVTDPKVAARLTPQDHGFATKRPPIDTHYFETFNLSHVTLVDVKEEPIIEIVPEGVRTSKKTYPLDLIVFATGFDAMTGALLSLNLTGSDGKSLRESWKAGPCTYLGLQTPGFPNLFTITGPGSPSVLCNMPVPIEQHVDWIARCISQMRKTRLTRIEAKQEAADEWVAQVNNAANETLLPMASSSWYLGANVPGKPRVFMPYAGGMANYARICDQVADDNYRGFSMI